MVVLLPRAENQPHDCGNFFTGDRGLESRQWELRARICAWIFRRKRETQKARKKLQEAICKKWIDPWRHSHRRCYVPVTESIWKGVFVVWICRQDCTCLGPWRGLVQSCLLWSPQWQGSGGQMEQSEQISFRFWRIRWSSQHRWCARPLEATLVLAQKEDLPRHWEFVVACAIRTQFYLYNWKWARSWLRHKIVYRADFQH